MRAYRRTASAAAALVLSLTALTGAAPNVPGLGGDPIVAEPFVSGTPAATDAGGGGADIAAGAPTRGTPRRTGPLPAGQAIAELRAATDKPPAIFVDPTGHLRSVAAPAGTALRRTPGAASTSDASAAAGAFVNRYGQAFGLRPGQQARRQRVDALPGGDRVVRFGQHVGGVPVLGGELVVTVNAAGNVVAAVGETPVGGPTATRATVSAATAGRNAVRAAATTLGLSPSALAVGETSLWLYDPRMIGAPGPGQLRPTWLVRVRHGGLTAPAATALIDASDGSTSLVYSEVKYGRSRLICDLNAAVDLNNPNTYRCDTAAGGPAVRRTEGGAASSIADVNRAYDFLGDTYNFFQRRVGRDSIDGRGMTMRATVRACHLNCPFENAFWEGSQMVFGPGFASADDVVGHELTHGVTDFSSQLFYAFQSGAINEAFSDIMGEFIDQTNGRGTDNATTKWQIGEDLPIGAIRDMERPDLPLGGVPCDGNPDDNVFQDGCQPDRVGSPLYAHLPILRDNGGVHINSGIANKAAYLLAEPGSHTFNGRTVTGIGLDKSVHLWYRTMLGMTSGGDYEDLGNLLQVSCRRLVGSLGFRMSDCTEVDDAVAATEMVTVRADGTIEADLCPTPGQPIVQFFAEDWEAATSRWVFNSGAQVVPNAVDPTRWATSGVSAAFLPAPPSSSITMAQFVGMPLAGTTYLRFAHNPVFGTPRLSINNGSTTTNITYGSNWAFVGARSGWGPADRTTGYVSTRFDISTFTGQNIKVAFAVDPVFVPTRGTIGQWMLDDIMIYNCSNDRPGPVRNLAGPRGEDGTSATLSWDAPLFSGPGIANYEIEVAPPLPGYPQTVSAGTTSHTINGLDRNRRYTARVRAFGTNASPADPVYLKLDIIGSCDSDYLRESPLWICLPFRPQKPTPFG